MNKYLGVTDGGLVSHDEEGRIIKATSSTKPPGTVMKIPWYWKIINWFQNKRLKKYD